MRFFIYIIFFCILFVLYVRYLEYRTLFIPSREILAYPSDVGLAYEDVMFKTQDGVSLNGWLIEAQDAHATMIFCHGNAGNIGDRLVKLGLFHKVGVNVFIFDYRGYGKSEGKPTEEGMYLDVMAAYDHLKSRSEIDPNKLLVYGTSLGGAAAVDLATKRQVAALVIDSSFTNAADIARRIIPFVPAFLVGPKLDSLTKIRKIRSPVIFFHSREDEMIPYELGRKLFEAANEPKRFVDLRGTHNEGLFQSSQIFQDELKKFLQDYKLI